MMEDNFKLKERQFEMRASATEPNAHGTYYWVYGKALVNGKFKLAVLGKYATNEEAEDIGNRKFPNGFEVLQLGTKDRARATSIIKAKMLNNQRATIDDVMVRAKHNI